MSFDDGTKIMNYLPATTYVAPPRLGRGRPLKTIVEAEECSFGIRSDSEGDDSDRTIIAKPIGLDAKLGTDTRARSRLSTSTDSTCSISQSPVASSPCSSVGDGSLKGENYTGSDTGTVFSEDSCPSLTGSNDTTFYTNSSRTSTSSNHSVMSSRQRSLSILIPRDSWQTEPTIKEITMAMSPARKIMLSPQALSSLSRNLPSLSGPPSFGEGSSIASSSPCIPAVASAPITPDLRNLVPVEGQEWNVHDQQMNTPLEIAIDEQHSIVLSPSQAYSTADRTSVGYSTDWSEMVTRFPEVPGGTPQEYTPISPEIAKIKNFPQEVSDNGVQLPTDALQLLQHLTRSYSPESESHQSGTSRAKFEMKERSDAGDQAKSPIASTPTPSDSDFSQLSIPSPGGFFSSLQASSRATWCLPSQPKAPSMPSSAIAANFYDIPFTRSQETVQTIVEAPESALTDGPPTARQANFAIPAEYRVDETDEDDDMYGAAVQIKSSSPELGHEYEDKYEDELKQHAGVNIDRTSSWLTAQNTYLSALRETNPMNDPAEYIPQTPHLSQDDNDLPDESPARKAVRFLEEAVRSSHTSDGSKKPARAPRSRDPVFLQAFDYCLTQKGRQDVFLQAAARLERINSTRLALPVQHIHSLLNTHTTETLQVHIRPKYRGPFSQNPRATGNFQQRTNEHVVFAEAERKQLAMNHILPAIWTTEALRKVLHKGLMFSCPSATGHLSRRTGSNKKLRVLDLAGAATGSWAWVAAQTWPHVNFVTVQAKVQSQHARRWPVSAKDGNAKVIQPTNPDNHRVLVVPELWRLPFADNHFDIISARTLHMFIRARPVPEVPSINEWDLVLKECMRVLKPGGIFDYVLLDSHISNNSTDNDSKHSRDHSVETAASISPTAAFGQGLTSPPLTSAFGPTGPVLNPAPLNFGRDLKRRGYDADGGCAKLAERLEVNGFTNHRSQWVGLPIGRTGHTHDNVVASYEKFEPRAPTPASTTSKATSGLQRSKIGSVSHANGRSRTPFPPAPRPISEVSTISRIIEQYSNVEAVQGPVGSTADVSDLAGLLGTMMWEEWLVRHRLEVLDCKTRQSTDPKENFDITFEATNLLHGINDVLAAGHAKGACFRTIVGWATKPGNKPGVKKTATTAVPARQTYSEELPLDFSNLSVNTNTTSLSNPTTYRARAQQRTHQDPAYQGYHSGETPTTAIIASSKANAYYGRGYITPIEFRRHDLSLDTRTPGGANISPQYTQSAVDRGEVGTIPMMIIE